MQRLLIASDTRGLVLAEFWNRDRNSGWQSEAKVGAVNHGLHSSNAQSSPPAPTTTTASPRC